uniref:Alpha/beta hydrolase domain-containing protein n=1 Tax=Phenylobacterium glaciei TaxID=2803784 RepID=A0A974P6Q9_9CAUL|nr:hypothetical protein JKL49_13165 [Phenylobacterium glaciei]
MRQPDTERFRTWEAAGLTHVSYQAQLTRNEKFQRDFGTTPAAPSEQMNRIYLQPFYDAALHHMNRWVSGGAHPQPAADRVHRGRPGDPRRPWCRQGRPPAPGCGPVAMNSATPVTDDFAGRLRGSNKPFDAAKLDALYGDEAGYLSSFRKAADSAVAAGVLMPRDVEPAVAEAAQEYRRAREVTAREPAAAGWEPRA